MKLKFEHAYDDRTFRKKENIGTLWTPKKTCTLLKNPLVPGLGVTYQVEPGESLMLMDHYRLVQIHRWYCFLLAKGDESLLGYCTEKDAIELLWPLREYEKTVESLSQV